MAIIIDTETKLVVQGLTGSEGSFHAGRNKEYGTKLVAGVTPGKGGTDHNGTPIFDTVEGAIEATGANTSMVFVPARFAADAVLESYEAGIDTIIAITEHIPAIDMARVVAYLRGSSRRATLIGPNCPGVISPGKANVGIIPGEICSQGPVGLVSRSGTLVYQIVHELTQLGIGQSTCVGIGGDAIPGSDFIDVLEKFEADPETELVVLVGEIGGDAEERAAAWAKANMSKPIVAYFAGREAPPGKRMGHAGAIVSGSKGTWQAKADAFEAAGYPVAKNPTEVGRLVAELRSKR
jgi:succinyl-CoA synthetase alpha subunit